MRYSKQRELILDWVTNNRIHPTAEVVYNMLKKKEPALSLGTVYRNLNMLAKNGDIIKIEVLGHSDHYDAKSSKHFHMICDCCKNIYDIPIEVAPSVKENVYSATRHEILSFDIALSGICKNCKLKGANENE